MLLTMKEILDRANKGNYAVGAPNVCSELDARGAIEVAEEMNAPLILDVAYSATPDIAFFGRYLRELCMISSVPIAINLDHGAEFSHAIHAMVGGFTSIMVDRSKLPFEENVRQVRELVKIAHSVGVTVEAELGHVGQGGNYEDDRKSGLTDPQMALKYIEETGVDCLAVAIGTAHGNYASTPYLDYDRLVEIKHATDNFPLVLHGSSSTGNEKIRRACELGINKVNIAYDLFYAAMRAVVEANLKNNAVYSFWDVAKNGYKAKLREQMELFGCRDKAWLEKSPGLNAKATVAE